MLVQIIYGGMGGHLSVAKAVANQLKKEGNSSYIVLVSKEPPDSRLQVELSMAGISFSYIGTGSSFLQRSYFVIALCGLLKRLGPSLVLNHNRVAVLPVAIYRFFRNSVRIVFRDNVPVAKKDWVDYMLLGLAHLSCTSVVYLTENSRRWSGVLAKPFRNWTIIENPIDLDIFTSNRFCRREVRIGIACRLEPEKRVDVAILAFRMLIDSGLENVQLVIAGDGQTKKELVDLAKEVKLSKHIVFTGEIMHSEMPSFYESLDIYIHTSTSENYSNSVLQAMSSGLPVIGADVAGIRELISNDCGLLVSSGSPREFASRMRHLVEQPSRRLELGMKARAYVEAHNSPSVFVSYLKSLSN